MEDIEDLNNDKFIDSLQEITKTIFNEYMNNKDISFNTLINSEPSNFRFNLFILFVNCNGKIHIPIKLDL